MRKQRNVYDSPVDALIAVTKRLSIFETRYEKISEDFFNDYNQGQLEDTADFVEWSNAYKHFVAIRHEIDNRLQYVA